MLLARVSILAARAGTLIHHGLPGAVTNFCPHASISGLELTCLRADIAETGKLGRMALGVDLAEPMPWVLRVHSCEAANQCPGPIRQEKCASIKVVARRGAHH
jgi:hypothetical protein